MSVDLENLLMEISVHGTEGRLSAPHDVFKRLKLFSTLVREAPPKVAGWRLIWRGADGIVLSMAVSGPLLLGRAADCAFVIADSQVSRRHCTIRPCGEGKDGNATIEDLGSSGGTWVNGVRVSRRVLNDGDIIQLGGFAIAFAR